MTEDEEMHSGNNGKLKRRKNMKTSIRDTMLSSTQERIWRQQFEIQREVQLKKEDEGINWKHKCKLSSEGKWRLHFGKQK